ECWPLFADPRDPKTGGQYKGWPKTITQMDCYAREPKAWLPTVEVEGMTDPVVQVIDESDSSIVYTLRISGTRFRPWVFKPGRYTLRIGQQPRPMKTLEGVEALPEGEHKTLKVAF
ncbi:MAG: hypothetical protein ACODAJ_12865, partial [Planctomycetota bacterium]